MGRREKLRSWVSGQGEAFGEGVDAFRFEQEARGLIVRQGRKTHALLEKRH
jgi:hypothetical protein